VAKNNSNKKIMNTPFIKEIFSAQLEQYKMFLNIGLQNDEENFRITVNDDLHSPFPTKNNYDSFTLGAFVEETLVGVVSFRRDGVDREKLRHKGILFRMYVAEKFRGIGIAKKLIQAVIDRAKEIQDIEQINLTVIAGNLKAKQLYENFGFKTFGTESNAIKWKGKYFTEDQMVLQLKHKQ
jgi:cyclohexyl-isocyanide hydratase